MVLTPELSSIGGILWTSGPSGRRLKMIGAPNDPLNKEECQQSLRIRFGTQTSSQVFHPDEGFDAEGIMRQDVDNSFGYHSIEDVIRKEVLETVGQDTRFESVDYLNIEEYLPRNYGVQVTSKISTGEIINFAGSVGVGSREQGI